MARIVPVNRGYIAIVSDEDYEWARQFTWHVLFFGSKRDQSRYPYAARTTPNDMRGKHGSKLMHREIIGTPKGRETDHINGNTLDNRRENLRICSKSQNLANQRRIVSHTSRFKGVSFYPPSDKWQAEIQCANVRHYLGRFDSEIEAARIYNAKAKELFGEFALLNVIGDE